MPKRSALGVQDAHDIAGEIVRRAMASQRGAGRPDAASARIYVVHMGDPPSASEQLQLLAARLMRWPIAIMPRHCATMEEWLARYAPAREG